MGRDPITREEEVASPRAVLARHLAFRPSEYLSTSEMEAIIEAGLADECEFEEVEPEWPRPGEAGAWTCLTDRWEFECRDGRPRLVPARSRPPGPETETERMEAEFAARIHALERFIIGRRLSDEQVAEIRRDPSWCLAFAEAKRADESRDSAGTPADHRPEAHADPDRGPGVEEEGTATPCTHDVMPTGPAAGPERPEVRTP